MGDYFATIDGLLIDINGVLTRGTDLIPGSIETLNALKKRDIPYRFIANTTNYCRLTLLERLTDMGVPIEKDDLYTATYVAAAYLREQEAASYYPLLLPDAQLEFSDIEVDEDSPEFVVIGDMGASFTYARLNKAFNAILNGAKLIALHKKRSWRTEDGMHLDAGPFVVALEYAANQSAMVLGKPSKLYFDMVLEDIDIPANRLAMIGDDIEIDVRGAQLLGMQGWLVKTGRFSRNDLGRGIWPERILDSFSVLMDEL